jgi:hypothetical protein
VTEAATDTPDVERSVAAFRAARGAIETAIMPLDTSVDVPSAASRLHLRAGGYVVLEDGAGARLGQILSVGLALEEATAPEQPSAIAGGATTHSRVVARLARGSGAILVGDSAPSTTRGPGRRNRLRCATGSKED